MNFINPFLLLFAAAASIPLLLHLFNKQRVKIIEFSTVKYLQALQKTRMRKLKIRQILLLILRTLALLMIALAFARPTIEGGYLPALGGKTTTTAILLLDVSGSMQTETNAGTYFERAKDKLDSILDDFTEKERTTLITFSNRIIYDSGEPSVEFERLRDAIQEIEPGYAEANPKSAFTRAFELLTQTTDPNLEIYVVSDFQGEAWRNFEFNLFESANLEPSIFLANVSLDEIDNVALTEIHFPNQIITTGRPFQLQADVRNFKPQLSAELLVALTIGENRVAQTDLSIPPDGEGTVTFTHTPKQSGFLSGEIAIDDDDLPPDNRAYFGMRVPSGNKIALISENDQEAYYIRNALVPEQGKGGVRQMDLIGAIQAGNANLFDYDVVIVDVSGRLPQPLVSSLRNYLNTGGAALFMMRPSLDFADFSSEIANPIFGVQTVEAPPLPKPGEGKYLLNRFELDHPLFSPYKQVREDKRPQAEFLGHYKVIESPKATVLARYSDNTPAVLEGNIGRGKALLFTFSPNEDYTDIVFRPLLVILLNRSVEYLVSEPLSQREQILAGSEVSRELGPQSARSFVMVTPLGDSVQVSPSARAGAVVFNLGVLDQPGIYQIFGDRNLVDLFAVNFPPEESEELYTDSDAVGGKIAGARIVILDYDANAAELIESARFGTELWKLFLLLGFILLLIEMAVAYSARRPEVSPG